MSAGIKIECEISGEMVEIRYGDAAIGYTTRIVSIEGLYLRGRFLFIDGLCHLRASHRSFALDRIHFIRELTRDGAHASVSAWLASYGVGVFVGQVGTRPTYILNAK